MIISVDYDNSRITIADHELNDSGLTLWLEDKHDFKNSLEECLKVDVRLKDFASIIKEERLNSYEGQKMHPKKGFVYKAQIEINEPIKWYREDASLVEQQWAREAVVAKILKHLVEDEVADQF